MVTVDKILDEITQLDTASREVILEVLLKRQIEERRKDIATNIKSSKKEYASGKLIPASAREIILQLNK